MKKLFTMICALSALAVLAASSPRAVLAEEDQPDAQFVKPPEKVETAEVTLSTRVKKEVLESSDVWLGVVPTKASTSCWIQPRKITTPDATRVATLGNDAQGVGEKFQVVLLKCPRGAIKTHGELKVDDFEKLGVVEMAAAIIERTK